ncbi:MAG: endopeptidase La [Clostridia bacterium]|nr:endopeptidase La [Clostridia bacterium]
MLNNEMMNLPLLPLRGLTVFPGSVITLDAGREKSIAAVEEAMKGDRRVFAVAQRDTAVERPQLEDLYTVGTIITIRQIMPLPDQTLRIMVQGETRAILTSVLDCGHYQRADVAVQLVQFSAEQATAESRAYMRTIVALAKQLVKQRGANMSEFLHSLAGEKLPGNLCDSVASGLFNGVEEKQQVLECFDMNLRLELTAKLIGEEMSITRLEEKIQQRVREYMDRANHEYYLREQIHAIQDELGDDGDEEIAEYRRKLAESAMPDEAREKVDREIRRLARTAAQSPESSVSQNYIEYMLELPWGVRQESEIDISHARKVLDADHFGLKEVKDRLVEYLAVRKTTDHLKSPIICLVGPPGVGKTSIAKSIARALNRKFTQMSLGGVHDEAEVRGHRKTYVGAMPGRIITSIQRCGTMNPVFLLDEIDKIARDMRGDPAAALLEALDPEQNSAFKDHYIEAPFDLSDVLFITTANSTDPIDRALLDRMEVIEVPSYTIEEKVKIAKRYLLPKQLENHGLKKGQLRASEKTMSDLIDGYTREAGVRTLERTIEKLCRKAALSFLENPERKIINLRSADLKTYLGPQRYLRQPVAGQKKVGVVNGLAWTQVGGIVMPVEAVSMDGKGMLELTGKLGEVMKESARLARSIARIRASEFGLTAEYFEKHDLHIHVPEGAVPKDGPSAGVAISCALLSAIANIPARCDIAMTGEVTLHGEVLPIGGVREKLLAAYRMGICHILLPKENEKDLEEIDPEILKKMEITLISTVDEALDLVLQNPKKMRLAI